VIAFAAIDLQQGEVVQLVGGRPDDVRVRWHDPVAVAKHWVDAGFHALHIVDLDAALGTGTNHPLVEAIIENSAVPVQVGGGMRDESTIDRMLAAGAARVIIGTRAIEEAEWRHSMAARFPNRLVVAADVRDQRVLTRGWTRDTELDWRTLIDQLAAEPLAGVLVTDVGREGQLAGIDEQLFRAVCDRSVHPVLAAGGIANNRDLARLAAVGAAGAVVGMALYTGAIDLRDLFGVLP
jgi:phosphoribosylformimino-5-aminoimidazole carboxamide ribotide isomerase